MYVQAVQRKAIGCTEPNNTATEQANDRTGDRSPLGFKQCPRGGTRPTRSRGKAVGETVLAPPAPSLLALARVWWA